jgi:hypothetical protein
MWTRHLWRVALNANIPVWKGYVVISLVVLVLFILGLGLDTMVYLVPRVSPTGYPTFFLAISFVAYYWLLINQPDWLTKLDKQRVKRLFARDRPILIEQIVSSDQVSRLESAIDTQDLALAKGQIKASEYQQAHQILSDIIQQKKNRQADLRQMFGIPETVLLTKTVFRLGPTATPFRNGLLATAFGLIPFGLFIFLATLSEGIWESLNFYGLYRAAINILGVPWGPLYLFFFGFFFYVIRGDYGVIKGLFFSSVLSVLNVIIQWLWNWQYIDGVELWGDSIRILVTYVFTGLMMDWMTIQFSWRRIRLSYDSPAFTTVASVAGTALTTLITGIATGTLDRLLSVALQGVSIAFGGQSQLGP